MRNRHAALTAAPVAQWRHRFRPFWLFFSPRYPLKSQITSVLWRKVEKKGGEAKSGHTLARVIVFRKWALLITGDFFFPTFAFVKIINNTSFLQWLKTTAKSGWCTCGRKKKKQMPISSFLRSLYCYARLKLQNRKTECFLFCVLLSIRLYNKEKLRETGWGKATSKSKRG